MVGMTRYNGDHYEIKIFLMTNLSCRKKLL